MATILRYCRELWNIQYVESFQWIGGNLICSVRRVHRFKSLCAWFGIPQVCHKTKRNTPRVSPFLSFSYNRIRLIFKAHASTLFLSVQIAVSRRGRNIKWGGYHCLYSSRVSDVRSGRIVKRPCNGPNYTLSPGHRTRHVV